MFLIEFPPLKIGKITIDLLLRGHRTSKGPKKTLFRRTT